MRRPRPAHRRRASIGAINSAIIAGNPSKQRVDALREFWHAVSASPLGIPYFRDVKYEDSQHQLLNQWRALGILLFGAPNFFVPRLPLSGRRAHLTRRAITTPRRCAGV
jgi:hypothetical protein